jgi:hypothetical protein
MILPYGLIIKILPIKGLPPFHKSLFFHAALLAVDFVI